MNYPWEVTQSGRKSETKMGRRDLILDEGWGEIQISPRLKPNLSFILYLFIREIEDSMDCLVYQHTTAFRSYPCFGTVFQTFLLFMLFNSF